MIQHCLLYRCPYVLFFSSLKQYFTKVLQLNMFIIIIKTNVFHWNNKNLCENAFNILDRLCPNTWSTLIQLKGVDRTQYIYIYILAKLNSVVTAGYGWFCQFMLCMICSLIHNQCFIMFIGTFTYIISFTAAHRFLFGWWRMIHA